MVRKSKLPETNPGSAGQRIFIGIGTNLGDRNGNIIRALRELQLLPGVEIVQISGLYNTEPVGYSDQDDFLNAVVELQATYSPEELLDAIQKIEQNMGRKREIRWGPRTIDVDILCIDDIIMNTNTLTIPHMEIARRRFVLVPFSEIAADFRVPGYYKTVKQLLEVTPDKSKVELNMTSCQVLKKLNEV